MTPMELGRFEIELIGAMNLPAEVAGSKETPDPYLKVLADKSAGKQHLRAPGASSGRQV